MRISLVRKVAIGLAAVAGSVGLSMAVPVAAHAEQTATAVQSPTDTTSSVGSTDGTVSSSSLYVKKALIGVIAADQSDGCTQYTYFYSDGSKAIVYRCLIIVKA